MTEMIVTIKGGKVEFEVVGEKGTRCLELTQAIEPLIGGLEKRILKNDFYKKGKITLKVEVQQDHHLKTG